MVSFFCDYNSPTFTCNEFDNRYNIICLMFDKTGVTDTFRDQHLLIRTLLSCLGTWDNGLRDLRFTERTENGSFLKNMLRTNKSIWQMFNNQLFPKLTTYSIHDVKNRLNKVLLAAAPNSSLKLVGTATRPGKLTFEKSYRRIISDVRLFDWISKLESNQKKFFKIYFAYGHIWATIPGAQYARVMLDTDRDLIIRKLKGNLGYEYVDVNHNDFYCKYGFHYGFDIYMKKIYYNHKIVIQFKWDNRVFIYLKYNNDRDYMLYQSLFNIQKSVDDNLLLIESLQKGKYDYYDIQRLVLDIYSKLSGIFCTP